MTHISSIGAGIYSDLSYSPDSLGRVPPSVTQDVYYKGLFVTELANGVVGTLANTTDIRTGEFRRIDNIREFPQMGTPPNIVNVPVYGSKISRQVQGQADAPTFEVTLNYVPSVWQSTAQFHGSYIGDGNSYAFRFTLLNSLPSSYTSTDTLASVTITSGTTSGWIMTVTAVSGGGAQLFPGMSIAGTSITAATIVAQLTTTDAGGLWGKAGTYLLSASQTTATINAASYAGTNLGTGSVANSQFFWTGKMEALQISPQLTDTNQATLTISIQSDFVGPYTTT